MQNDLIRALIASIVIPILIGAVSGCSTNGTSQSATPTTVSGYVDVGVGAHIK